MDDWGDFLRTLTSVLLGGGISYLVMARQIRATSDSKRRDALIDLLAGYWAAADRTNSAGELLYVANAQDAQAKEHGELEFHDESAEHKAAVERYFAAKAEARELLGRIAILLPQMEHVATELLVASGVTPLEGADEQFLWRKETLRRFEDEARGQLGIKVPPSTRFWVSAGQ